MPTNSFINKLPFLLLPILFSACTTVIPVNLTATLGDSRPSVELKFTFLGTSSLLVESTEATLLIDGFVTRPGLIANFVGYIDSDTKTIERVFSSLETEQIDGIFVAHTHHDHALDAANIAYIFGAALYGSESLLNIASSYELQRSQLNVLTDGHTFKSQNGLLDLTTFTAEHSPPIPFINDDGGRTIGPSFALPARLRDFYAGDSFEFILRTGDLAIYILPSAAINKSPTPRQKADVLFIATPRFGLLSNQYSKNYVQQALEEIDPQLVIPFHWDNFTRPLGTSLKGNPLFTMNLKLIRELAEQQNRNYCVLQAMQTLEFELSGNLKCGLDRSDTSAP